MKSKECFKVMILKKLEWMTDYEGKSKEGEEGEVLVNEMKNHKLMDFIMKQSSLVLLFNSDSPDMHYPKVGSPFLYLAAPLNPYTSKSLFEYLKPNNS